MVRGLCSNVRAVTRIDACLAQCIESERTFDPSEAVINWLASCHVVVSVTAVKTRLTAVVARPELINSDGALP